MVEADPRREPALPNLVNVTILGPATSPAAASMHERVKTAIQRDLQTSGAAAVLLSYTAATDSYRIEAATEHLGLARAAGTARIQHRIAEVRAIVLACGARVDGP